MMQEGRQVRQLQLSTPTQDLSSVTQLGITKPRPEADKSRHKAFPSLDGQLDLLSASGRPCATPAASPKTTPLKLSSSLELQRLRGA